MVKDTEHLNGSLERIVAMKLAHGPDGVFGAPTMLSLLVFLAVGTLAFAVMVGMRAREAVRRRAARVGVDDEAPGGRRSLRYSGVKAAQKLIDYTTKHYSSADSKDMKVLRRRLMRAGIYDSRAAAVFFLSARRCWPSALGCCRVLRPADAGLRGQSLVLAVRDARPASSAIWRRASISTRLIAKKRLEHQAGFPDFMDLLVVCADAGLVHGGLARPRRRASSAIPIRRSPPTSTWRISKSAPAAP